MGPLRAFSDPHRDPVERTVSIAYVALVDIYEFNQQINHLYQAQWFLANEIPELIFDHKYMVQIAMAQIKYRASQHPILFELLPEKFTLPQLQVIYESIYGKPFDDRNFHRKFISTGLLVKQKEKNKLTSKKGAYYYKLDKEKYNLLFNAFLNIIPHPRSYILENNSI